MNTQVDIEAVMKAYYAVNGTEKSSYLDRDFLMSLAIAYKNIDLVESLLELGVIVNPAYRISILQTAVLEDRLKLLRLLLLSDSDKNYVALLCIEHGKLDSLRYLISTGFVVTDTNNCILLRALEIAEKGDKIRNEIVRELDKIKVSSPIVQF